MRMSASVAAVLLVVGGTAGAVAVSTTAESAPTKAGPVVSKPIEQPAASTAPKVAEEMNSPDPELAEGVDMRPIPKSNGEKLVGSGDGAGCLGNYGEPGQCVPIIPPSHEGHTGHTEHQWTCSEMRTLFPQGVKVVGGDPQNLDTNGDRIACGKGD